MNVQQEILNYQKSNDHTKRTLGPRLLRVGTQMTRDIKNLESWLTEAHSRLPMDRTNETFTDVDEERESKWMSKYAELVRLLKMREMILNAVV